MCLHLESPHLLQLILCLVHEHIHPGRWLTKISFLFYVATISKLLHKTLQETKQLLSPLCSLPPLHSRIPPLLQLLLLPGQRLRIATAPRHSHPLSTISGQVLECHLKICLTSPGEGNAYTQFNCKCNECPNRIFKQQYYCVIFFYLKQS